MEQMVQDAIESGLTSLGFSSHCYTGYPFDDCQINYERIDDYFLEIQSLKEKYSSQIDIYAGFELESRVYGEVRPTIDKRCDYTIGSSHILRSEGQYFSIDNTPEIWNECLKSTKGIENALNIYYTDYLDFAKTVPFDIIGHIDLYTKFNEEDVLYDEYSFKDIVIPYIDELIKTGKIFEVNTGAISRCWRSTPYPSKYILQRLKEKNAPIMINSDSHSIRTLTCAFEETEEMLKSLGFTHQMYLSKEGFVPVKL